MKTYCSTCGEINSTQIICPKCNKKVLVTPPDYPSTTKGTWDKTAMKRSLTQVYVDEMSDLYEANKARMSNDGQKTVLGGKYREEVEENFQDLLKKANKTNNERKKILHKQAKKNVTGVKSVANGSDDLQFLQNYEKLYDDLEKARKARDILVTAPGVHRRNSIGFESSTMLADDDMTDYKRSLLGNGPSIDETKLERLVKIAILSVHGTDNKDFCDGFNTQFQTNLSKWDAKYRAAMSHEKDAEEKELEIWIKKMLYGRARPDVIVLLEGHVSDAVCNPLSIEGTVYNRKDSALQLFKKDHVQNVTGWVRNGLDPNLEFSIKEVMLKGTHKTQMGLITHKVDGKSYYELVCHLPNEHCQSYTNMSPSIETWYSDNKTHIANSLGIDADNIINVMGDTNFNTDYDKIWSSAPSFGGYIDATTYNKAFPASSADNSKFMRQMCNEKVDWANVLIRVHRASYLNHIPVRKGKDMEKFWGTDHPSFMSYTSIYKK